MDTQGIKNSVLKVAKKVVRYIVLPLALFFGGCLLILHLPIVQKRILNAFTSQIKEASGFNITFGGMYLWWFDRVNFKNIKIIDPEKNTMVGVDDLTVNYNLFSFFMTNEIVLEEAILSGAGVYLTTIKEGDKSDLNFNYFIDRLSSDTTSASTPTKFGIGRVILKKSFFRYNDKESQKITNGFDYNHFTVDIEEADVNKFRLRGDSIMMQIESLTARDRATGLKIKNSQSYFLISDTSMEFLGANIKVGNSILRDTIVLRFKAMDGFSDFTTKVNIKAHLDKSKIDPNDLEYFTYGGGKPFFEAAEVSGDLSGRVNHFKIKNLKVSMGGSNLIGKIFIDGLPEVESTFVNLTVEQGDLNLPDLKQAMPDHIYAHLKTFGRTHVKGNFIGFFNDFVSTGEFKSDIGYVKSDVNLKFHDKGLELSKFEGSLQLVDFDLGKYLQDTTLFQTITMAGTINGVGLTRESTNFYLHATIPKMGICHYDYADISTEGRFARQFFIGQLEVKDPNLRLNGRGSLDLRSNRELIKMRVQIDSAMLHKLGFVKDYFRASTTVNADTHGLALDSIVGKITLTATDMMYRSQKLVLDSVKVESIHGKPNIIRFSSNFVKAVIKGDYTNTALVNDVTLFVKELLMQIENDKPKIEKYYKLKAKPTKDYGANFVINVRNLDPIFKLAGIDLNLSSDVKIIGDLSMGSATAINTIAVMDTIRYGKKTFIKNQVELALSKEVMGTDVLAMASIHSARQELSPLLTTCNWVTDVQWNNDKVDVTMKVDQKEKDRFIDLRSEVTFLNDSIRIEMLPSYVKLLNKKWTFSPDNYILTNREEWHFNKVELKFSDQSLSADGYISKNPAKELMFNVSNLDLSSLNAFSSEKFGGVMNGDVKIRDMYQHIFVSNDVEVKNFTINNFLIGDVRGENKWNNEEDRVNVNVAIDRLNERTLSVTGYYDDDAESPLNIAAELEKTNLKTIEPLLRDIFPLLEGDLSGEFLIRGSLAKPSIVGHGILEKGKVKVATLQTQYAFKGRLNMKPDTISFEDFNLTDAFGNKAVFGGYISYHDFDEMGTHLKARFNNFQILNTVASENTLYYGQAYATGQASLSGTFNNLKISATAKTEKKTRLFIPIKGTASVDKKEYITFVNLHDTTKTKISKKTVQKRVKPSGISVDLNLDITPDAYGEIIFDIKSGDIVRGYGKGSLKLQLDTQGDFTMFGQYEFESGNYNFTLFDVINKEFSINKGSSISWAGDPLGGVLNINAMYKQLVSYGPILLEQTPEVLNSPQIRRRYPAEVLLTITGQMMTPQIAFDIQANDLPKNDLVLPAGKTVNLPLQFNSFKARVDEQELKKQVFSIIVLRRFSSSDAFSAQATAVSSVSELFSNQLSYWLSQMDENLEIDLDVASMNNEQFNTFQLRLSYSLFNGRLRFSRDGVISSNTNSAVANAVGEWTIDYLLTPDGRYKVRMYNRTNYNQITAALGTQATIVPGVSISQSQTFNHLKDLFTRARRQRKESSLQEEEDLKND